MTLKCILLARLDSRPLDATVRVFESNFFSRFMGNTIVTVTVDFSSCMHIPLAEMSNVTRIA